MVVRAQDEVELEDCVTGDPSVEDVAFPVGAVTLGTVIV